MVRLAGGLAGLYPPLDFEGWDDMSVWVAEIFFRVSGRPVPLCWLYGDCVSCCVCVDTEEVDK